MEARGLPVHWPRNPAPYLIDWLLEVGPTAAGAMGESFIGWQDLAAWSQITGIEPDPWEARTLRRLSMAYLHQQLAARKPNCAPPYVPGLGAEVQDKVTQQFRAMVEGLKNRRSG